MTAHPLAATEAWRALEPPALWADLIALAARARAGGAGRAPAPSPTEPPKEDPA
ncbi:hypothetical protein [Nocardiopsis trehalosi]|uniref:hypothetical protein n=1 Tax=Nocardiopsis trehalosi TaxID=109329 RepID=UPI000A6CFA6B|nr:hypothetical protein [Nocardiopsis trehalosi]